MPLIPLCRKHWLAAIAAFVIFVVAIVLLHAAVLKYQYYFGMYHDDGVYLVSAESLCEGKGYHILSLPGEPFQTKYPIGYPFFLSLLIRALPPFPSNLLGLETAQSFLSVCAVIVAVAYLVSTKRITLLLGVVIGGASILNMRFIDFAPMLMSDLVGASLVVVCMWCAEWQCRKPDGYSPWAAILLVLAVTSRTQSIILIPTLVIFYVARKRFKSLGTMLFLAGICIAPQMVWQSQFSRNSPEILSFYTNYLKHTYDTLPPTLGSFGVFSNSFDSSVIMQINAYFPGLEQIRYQDLSPMAFFLLYSVFYYLLAIPPTTGLLVLLKRASLPALYCLFYGITFSVWPIRLEWRHILPVVVFAYYFYFVGFRFYASRIKKLVRINNRACYSRFCGVAAVVFGCYLVVGAGLLSCSKAGWTKALSAPPIPATASEFQEAVAWVRANAAPNAVFVCNNDPVFYLYTKRHAIMPSRLELWRFASDKYVDADSLRQAIGFSKATYVMNEPAFRTSGFTYAQLHDTVAELHRLSPDALLPVYRTRSGLVEIYSVGSLAKRH